MLSLGEDLGHTYVGDVGGGMVSTKLSYPFKERQGKVEC